MKIAKSSHLRLLLQTQDAVLATGLFAATCSGAWLGGFYDVDAAVTHLQLTPAVLLLASLASAMSAPRLHGEKPRGQVLFALRYGAILVMGLLALIYFGQMDWIERGVIGAFAVMLPLVLWANRLFLKWWYLRGRREHPDNYLKVLVIGSGARGRRLARTYVEGSEWGVHIVGMLDPDPRQAEVDGIPVLGTPDDIGRVLARQVIDEVVVCLPRSLINDAHAIARACEEEAVCLKFMADIYDIESESVGLEMIGGVPILSFEPVSREEGGLVAKRTLDLVLTLVALIPLLPLFALIALAIKLESRGPVFFTQERVGLNKRIFRMIKFRSMYVDAEQRLAELEHLNEASGPIFKMRNDPRVTRVGRLLRKTSIDELPQLINVLKGDMSLIGPRPMSVRDVSLFSLGIQRRRFSVKPGLACLREVSGRSRLSFERWLELDLQYIEQWSLWLDLKILVLLIPAVLRGDGAS